MRNMYPTVVLTGLLTLALGLSACSNLRGESSTGSVGSASSGATGASGSSGSSGSTGSSGASGTGLDGTVPPGSGSASMGTTLDPSGRAQGGMDSGGQSGAQGASGALGSTASSDAQDVSGQRTGAPTSASATPNGTVISIEPLASNASGGSSASGTSGTSGSSATGSGAEQAYRITLRMDDGSTQVVSQATAPTYRSGDRVNLSTGVISR